MTTVATRMAEIKLVEEFDVVFLHESEAPIDVKTNGLPRFDFERRMKGTATVQEWRAQRFARIYPGKRCIVLYADGSEAPGQTTLAAVRASYEEGAPPAGP
ncbi:MAG: hypothetical protein ACRELB_04150 [Polyangiaceae bacterium]